MFFWDMSWPDDCAMCLFCVSSPRLLLTALQNHRPGSPTPQVFIDVKWKKQDILPSKKTWITFQRYSSLDMLKWDRRGVELCTFLALIMVFAMMQHSALSVAACAQIVQCLGGQANLASGAIPQSKPVTLLSSRL